MAATVTRIWCITASSSRRRAAMVPGLAGTVEEIDSERILESDAAPVNRGYPGGQGCGKVASRPGRVLSRAGIPAGCRTVVVANMGKSAGFRRRPGAALTGTRTLTQPCPGGCALKLCTTCLAIA